MKHEEFGKKVGAAISELKQVKPQEIILVHHDDADGLCSGAVVKAGFEYVTERNDIKLYRRPKIFAKYMDKG